MRARGQLDWAGGSSQKGRYIKADGVGEAVMRCLPKYGYPNLALSNGNSFIENARFCPIASNRRAFSLLYAILVFAVVAHDCKEADGRGTRNRRQPPTEQCADQPLAPPHGHGQPGICLR